MSYDEAITMTELCRAVKECRKDVSYKDGVTSWYVHRLTRAESLHRDLKAKRYKLRPGTKVQIYRPKRREAVAPFFRDRVWQRSMCNNGVYHDLTKSLIYDNVCCQKGKGSDMAIRRVIKFLQKLVREGAEKPIYGVHLDIRKYFPSTPQRLVKELDRQKIADERFLPFLDELIDSMKDERDEGDIALDPFGRRGTGLGAQINQLHQIALIDALDHRLKCFCKYYIRYNDDFLILDHDRAVVERARKTIKEYLQTIGLEMTDKSGVFTVQKNGFYFMRKRFIVTKTGKVVIRLHKKALHDERKTLKGLKRRVLRGERTMADVQRHYQSWVASASYAGDAPIREMDKFYTELFRQHPQYKLKKRYLYGNRKRS